jgi:hypothetical protein
MTDHINLDDMKRDIDSLKTRMTKLEKAADLEQTKLHEPAP